MHSTDKIAILMATYNGEKYICQQIDSILSQTCKDWELYIHDDGSTDNTIAAVESYVEKYPDKIQVEQSTTSSICLVRWKRHTI
mgnify:CR=1 FL=1